MECMDFHKEWGIFYNISVESESRDNFGVNETSDEDLVWNHSTREYFSK